MKVEMTVGVDVECSPKRYIACKEIYFGDTVEEALAEMTEAIILAIKGVGVNSFVLEELYSDEED